ncbi:hypothetical protein RSAG8_12128, partial [Rhizoctonia solani AG-8 WAC10335]
MRRFMLDSNQKELQIIKSTSILNGVFFDPVTGPITASRPAVILNTGTGRVREIDDSATEDIFPESELDARYAQLGWPCPSKLPGKAWDLLTPRNQRTVKNEIWGSRFSTLPKPLMGGIWYFITWLARVVDASTRRYYSSGRKCLSK